MKKQLFSIIVALMTISASAQLPDTVNFGTTGFWNGMKPTNTSRFGDNIRTAVRKLTGNINHVNARVDSTHQAISDSIANMKAGVFNVLDDGAELTAIVPDAI